MNRYYGIAFTEWDAHRSTLLWIACEKWMMRPLLLGHPILGIYWESATERIITAYKCIYIYYIWGFELGKSNRHIAKHQGATNDLKHPKPHDS